MAGRTTDGLLFGEGDRLEWSGLTRSSRVPAGMAARAGIVLLAADATPNHQIAEKVGVSRPTVNNGGPGTPSEGWTDWPTTPGRDRRGAWTSADRHRDVDPAAETGGDHWSSRLLAHGLG